MRDYGGLATRQPWQGHHVRDHFLAAAGLPMLNGFVGEFLILSGTISVLTLLHLASSGTGVIFGATYLLWMIQRVFYGKLGVRLTAKSGAGT